MYVIQERFRNWKKWDTLDGRYTSLEEAKDAFNQLPKLPLDRRIAEEYTVTRYKAVKGLNKPGRSQP